MIAAGGPAAPAPPGRSRGIGAALHPEEAAVAVDGDPRTRWATHHPQQPGDWIELTFTAPAALAGVRLNSARAPYDDPRDLQVETSPDGVCWERQRAAIRTDGTLYDLALPAPAGAGLPR